MKHISHALALHLVWLLPAIATPTEAQGGACVKHISCNSSLVDQLEPACYTENAWTIHPFLTYATAVKYYRFHGQQGETAKLVVSSEDFVPRLALTNPHRHLAHPRLHRQRYGHDLRGPWLDRPVGSGRRRQRTRGLRGLHARSRVWARHRSTPCARPGWPSRSARSASWSSWYASWSSWYALAATSRSESAVAASHTRSGAHGARPARGHRAAVGNALLVRSRCAHPLPRGGRAIRGDRRLAHSHRRNGGGHDHQHRPSRLRLVLLLQATQHRDAREGARRLQLHRTLLGLRRGYHERRVRPSSHRLALRRRAALPEPDGQRRAADPGHASVRYVSVEAYTASAVCKGEGLPPLSFLSQLRSASIAR